MLKHNQIDIRGPIMHHKDIIGMAIGATHYASKAFQSGGVPPAVLQGPFQSGAAAQRASEDVAQATARLAKEGRPVMALPSGHELKAVGFSPEDMQLIELQKFCVEQCLVQLSCAGDKTLKCHSQSCISYRSLVHQL